MQSPSGRAWPMIAILRSDNADIVARNCFEISGKNVSTLRVLSVHRAEAAQALIRRPHREVAESDCLAPSKYRANRLNAACISTRCAARVQNGAPEKYL